MNIYIFAIAGLIVGATLGWIAPLHIPIGYANYTAVAVLAALDAVFGGSRAALERKQEESSHDPTRSGHSTTAFEFPRF